MNTTTPPSINAANPHGHNPATQSCDHCRQLDTRQLVSDLSTTDPQLATDIFSRTIHNLNSPAQTDIHEQLKEALDSTNPAILNLTLTFLLNLDLFKPVSGEFGTQEIRSHFFGWPYRENDANLENLTHILDLLNNPNHNTNIPEAINFLHSFAKTLPTLNMTIGAFGIQQSYEPKKSPLAPNYQKQIIALNNLPLINLFCSLGYFASYQLCDQEEDALLQQMIKKSPVYNKFYQSLLFQNSNLAQKYHAHAVADTCVEATEVNFKLIDYGYIKTSD